MNEYKDLNYYATSKKIFWVVNKDINAHLHANDIVPCIFVSKEAGRYNIVQLDPKIADDKFTYTGAYFDLLQSNGKLRKDPYFT